MEITSMGNPRIKEVVKLSKNKKFRQEKQLLYFEGEFFLEFINELEYLIETIYTTNYDFYVDGVEIIYTPTEVFQKISKLDYKHGYVFIADMPKLNNEITGDKVLYLENIADPGNLGTILRTALAFNFTDIILSENCVDVFNEKVIRASKGTLFKLNIVANATVEKIKELKDKDYKVVATTLDGNEFNTLTDMDKVVVMLGSEGNGLTDAAMQLATDKVTISMSKDVESLNVAAAAAIILNHLK